MDKKILPSFELSRLVFGSYRTYINLYANNSKGERKHYRLTFNLNRIHNLHERKKRGKDLVRKINFWLAAGHLMEDFKESICMDLMKEGEGRENYEINIVDAIEMIVSEKVNATDKRSSKRSHTSHGRQFITFLKYKKLTHLDVAEFSTFYARAYIQYWDTVLKIENNNTYNVKLAFVKLYFNWLVKNEYIEKNPFLAIDKRKSTKAKKDNFTIEEQVIVNQALKDKNVWLWVAAQLAFWGLIRQEELSRLQFKHFDFQNWCINLTADMTKNGKDDIVTLPDFLKAEFQKIGFFEQPINCYVFGSDFYPSMDRINERKINKWHGAVLIKMEKKELIIRRKGLSFSSWRRSGMDYFSRVLTPREFKDHNRHDSFATTEKYLPTRKVNKNISILQRK